jgi:hypothetical protein
LAAAGYANQTVFLAFRNNSYDRYVLMIDNVQVCGAATVAKDITLSPGSVGFGYQSVTGGASSTQTVFILNTGQDTLSIYGVTLGGTHANDFAIVGDTGQTTLASGAWRTVTLQFDPTVVGVRTATLSVASDDPDESIITASLSGTGVDPVAGVTDPIWVDFTYAGIEDGSEANPFNTLAEGRDFVTPAGTVYLKAGTTAEAIRVTKAMRLEAPSGTARAGATP